MLFFAALVEPELSYKSLTFTSKKKIKGPFDDKLENDRKNN